MSRCSPATFPEGEVGGIPLARLDVDAVAGVGLLHLLTRQLPVAVEGRDVVVDRPVNLVGEAIGDESFGQRDHVDDMVGRPGHHVGGKDVEEGLVLEPRRGVEVGDLGRRPALERGGLLDLVGGGEGVVVVVSHVPDIGDVLHVPHLVAEVLERAVEQITEQVGPQVADVRVLVDRAPARVDPDLPWLEGLEGIDPARQRVMQANLRKRCSHGRWQL